MMPMYHRTMASSRINELLENLKAEFETLAHDLNLYKMQKDDYEKKLQAQLNELTSIQNTLYELERNHTKIKQQYEEEILRLKREIQNPGSVPFHGANGTNETARNGSDKASPMPPLNNPIFQTINSTPLDKRNLSSPVPSNTKRPRETDNFYGTSLPSITLSENAPNLKQHKTEKEPILPAPNFPKETAVSRPVPNPTTNSHMHTTVPSIVDSLKDHVKDVKPPQHEVEKRRDQEEKNQESADWIVGYHPNVQPNLNIDLAHTLEHKSVVCCVKFSNDGKYLATGCNRSAQIYDVESGEKIHTFADENLKDGDLYIRSVCFSPDGKYLAAGAEDKTVKVWDIEHKRTIQNFMGHELDIYSLDFSHDGSFIVSGSGDKKAKIWNMEKGKCVYTLGNDEVGPKDGVTSVAISPDGRLVAAGSLDYVVRLWDTQTGYFLERYEGHADSVYSVAFSPDGKSLASGSLDKTLKLWDFSGQRNRTKCRNTFQGHKDFVLSVAFSPDGNWLISGSKDRSVQFWDIRTAVAYMMLQGHKNSVISVALNPMGGTFATGSGDFRARIWRYKCFAFPPT